MQSPRRVAPHACTITEFHLSPDINRCGMILGQMNLPEVMFRLLLPNRNLPPSGRLSAHATSRLHDDEILRLPDFATRLTPFFPSSIEWKILEPSRVGTIEEGRGETGVSNESMGMGRGPWPGLPAKDSSPPNPIKTRVLPTF